MRSSGRPNCLVALALVGTPRVPLGHCGRSMHHRPPITYSRAKKDIGNWGRHDYFSTVSPRCGIREAVKLTHGARADSVFRTRPDLRSTIMHNVFYILQVSPYLNGGKEGQKGDAPRPRSSHLFIDYFYSFFDPLSFPFGLRLSTTLLGPCAPQYCLPSISLSPSTFLLRTHKVQRFSHLSPKTFQRPERSVAKKTHTFFWPIPSPSCMSHVVLYM